MTALIANGEFAVEPSLLARSTMPEFAPLDIPEFTALRIVRKGMKMVTHGGLGTARKYNLSSDFYLVRQPRDWYGSGKAHNQGTT